jgi:hypothetical protein
MGKAKAILRNRQISAREFKAVQKTWLNFLGYFSAGRQGGGYMEGNIGEARNNAN